MPSTTRKEKVKRRKWNGVEGLSEIWWPTPSQTGERCFLTFVISSGQREKIRKQESGWIQENIGTNV